MGSSSSSGDSSEVGASAFEIVTTLGGAILGMGVLFLGVTGVIMSLPDPTQTHQLGGPKMKTADEAAQDAKKRLEKWHDEQAMKYEYHLKGSTLTPEQMNYAQNMLKEHRKPIIIQSSLDASKAAKARLAKSARADKAKPRKGAGWGSKSSPPASAKWKMGAEYVQFKDARCEDERSFLLELLTDRQLNEFIEYIEEEYGEEGYKKVEKEYYAETLKKDSCCCGATVEDPCACMIEGVMDCSAVEPKCPCYAAETFASMTEVGEDNTLFCDQCGINVEDDPIYADFTLSCYCGNILYHDNSYGPFDIADYYGAEEELVEYVPEEMIPVGSKVRSYDFWPYDKTCYKEGVIVDHAPSPSCSPNCLHYHIRTTKVVRRGKLHSEEKGEIFMTHPYADIFDQEYSGQLAPHIQIIFPAWVK